MFCQNSGHLAGFRCVSAGPVCGVCTIVPLHAKRAFPQLNGRRDQKISVIKEFVRIQDQTMMLAAVMPAERHSREEVAEYIKDTFEFLCGSSFIFALFIRLDLDRQSI